MSNLFRRRSGTALTSGNGIRGFSEKRGCAVPLRNLVFMRMKSQPRDQVLVRVRRVDIAEYEFIVDRNFTGDGPVSPEHGLQAPISAPGQYLRYQFSGYQRRVPAF